MPAAPQSVIITTGDGVINVGWATSLDAVTSYTVYYQVTGNGSSLSLAPTPATATSVTIEGLVNGTAYSVWVTATGNDGESAPSDVQNNLIPLGAPTQPGLAAVHGPAAGQLTFTITPPSDYGDSANNLAVLTYRLYEDAGALPFITDISETTLIVGPADLTVGVSADFTVVATNGPGVSAPSEAVTITPLGAPSAPLLTAEATDGSVSLTLISMNGLGGDIEDNIAYTIYKRINGINIPITVSSTSFSYTDNTVENGVGYVYYAAASNSSFSNNSEEITVTPLGKPSVPSFNLSAGDKVIVLTFNTIDSGAGNNYTDVTYNIFQDDILVSSKLNDSSFSTTNINNGTDYSYRTSISNALFTSDLSNPLTITPYGAPEPPTVTIKAQDSTIILNVTPPTDTGGTSTLSYAVYKNGELFECTPPGQITDTDVVNGVLYTYDVYVTNGILQSDAATVSATPLGQPSIPNLSADPSDGQVVLTITPPISTGSNNITYKVYKNGVLSFMITGASVSEPTVSMPITLTNGVAYAFKVSALNLLQESDFSNEVSVMPLSPPSQPGLVAVAGPNLNEITLTVTPPLNYGDMNANSVQLTYKFTQDGDTISPQNNNDGTWTVTIFNGGQTYNYAVITNNGVFDSIPSAESSVTVAVPSSAGLLAYGYDGYVTLTVQPPSSTGGDTMYYTITRAEGESYDNVTLITSDTTATEYIDENLVNGTIYYYSVAASNSAFFSFISTDAAAIPLRAPVLGGLVAAVDLTVSQRVKLTVTITDIGYDISSGPLLTYEFKRGTTVVTADPSDNGVWILDGEPVGNSVSYTVTATNQNGLYASASSNTVTPRIYATVNGTTSTVVVVDPATFDVATVTKDTPVAVNTGSAEAPNYVTAIATDITGEVYNSGAANALLGEAMETAIDSGISSMLVKRIFPGDTTPTNSLIELGTPAAPLTSATAGGAKSTRLDLPAATYTDGSPLPPNKTVVACDITPRTDGQAGSYILVKVQVDGATLTDGFSIPITIIDNSAPGLTGYPLYHFVNGAWKILVTLPPDLSDPTGCTYSGLLTENQDYAGLAPPADVPGSPAKPTTVAQVGAITVNYSAPAHTGGSAITSYRIYWSGANATSGDITTTGPVTTATVTNLLANTNYTFVVAAINADGEGPDSLRSDPIQTATPSPPGPICFMANAPVLTPRGYRRIDSLRVGDLVRLANGCSMEIKAVKVVRYQPSPATNPFVIPKGTFGAKERLLISPSHRVSVPGRGMVEARNLGLKQWTMHEAFDYYNLELEKWENMVVAGVEVESLAPMRRAIVTKEQFRQLLAAKYGARASEPEMLSKILRTCYDAGNGYINIPCLKQ
jgi:titin